MIGTVCSKEAFALGEGKHNKHQSGLGPALQSLAPSLLHVVDDRQDAHLLLSRVHVLILLLGHSCA